MYVDPRAASYKQTLNSGSVSVAVSASVCLLSLLIATVREELNCRLCVHCRARLLPAYFAATLYN